MCPKGHSPNTISILGIHNSLDLMAWVCICAYACSDMAYLDQISPYVLAGIGSTVDTNKATADGTYAAVVRTAEMLKLPKDFKVFIQVFVYRLLGLMQYSFHSPRLVLLEA